MLSRQRAHQRYTKFCVTLKAERPELYAAVLAVLRGSSRAAVRRELYARRLARRAAMACVEFLCAGASRFARLGGGLGLEAHARRPGKAPPGRVVR